MNNFNNMQNSNMNNQYFRQKNNGKGVLYASVAIAALVFAIMGATFAYFTASAQSSDNALAAVAAHVEVNYTEGRQLKATNLIPASAAVVTKAYAQKTAYDYNISQGCTYKLDATIDNPIEANPESYTDKANWTCPTGKVAKSTGETGTKCVDDNGYYVCAVYQFSVTNASNVKQTLQANLSTNYNTFTTTTDGNGVLTGKKLKDGTTNGTGSTLALKFMAVRSASLIDTEAISSVSNSSTCTPYAVGTDVLTAGILTSVADDYKTITTASQTTRFCDKIGDDDADAQLHSITTDSAGVYLYYNTTALAQSVAVPTTSGTVTTPAVQNIFSGYVLAAINNYKLGTDGSIVYLTTTAGDANVTQIGVGDKATAAPTTIYADDYGNEYGSDSTCAGKAAISSCNRVYLTTNGSSSGVIGSYGQVTETFYIVAWLQETNMNQDVDQDESFASTITVTSGADLGSNISGITGTMNS